MSKGARMGSPLVAFALVAEEYEKSGDPIRGLKPLFAPILASRRGGKFIASDFAKSFKELYGLDMSTFVAGALSERMSEIGLLVRSSAENLNHPEYRIENFDWSSEGIEESQIDQTIKLFSRWAKNEAERLGRKVSEHALEEAILIRLSRPEFVSIFVDEDAGEKKNNKIKTLLGVGAVDVAASDDVFFDYIVARFILQVNDVAPEVFLEISKIAYGSLIADAVAGLAVPDDFVAKDPPLRVVVDGPLILDLLDLNTVEHRIYAEGLMQILRDAHLRLAIFEHSIEEMRATIRSTLAARSRGEAFGPMAERFRNSPGHSVYASAVADSLEARVKSLGLAILRSEIYEEARFKKYFSDEREDSVRNSIGDLHEHVDARIRDAKSVATVARLKGDNRFPDSILDAGTIFVTRNSVLCKRVLRTLALGRIDPDPRFTIATDGQLAGVLWFVSGAKGLDLSRRRLVANCSSAVLPKREVVSRITKFLSALDPVLKEEFGVLMADRRASLCPMRLTGGLAEAVDESRSLQILEEMRRELSAEHLERADAAEREVAQLRSEVQDVTTRSQEAVLVLQGAVESTSIESARSKFIFNQQIAQLSLDLEVANREIFEYRNRFDQERKEVEGRIAIEQSALNLKRQVFKRKLKYMFSFIAFAASTVSIIVPDYSSFWFRVLLFMIYVTSLALVSRALNYFSDRLSIIVYRSRQRYLDGLKESRGFIDAEGRETPGRAAPSLSRE